ncbi:MAG: chromosome segregation protein SMC [Planctomycetes bacterium]|nr:chromosome segregation protein SMC [Planctomycetota bacterium]
MRLQRLIVHGFKSFADRTEFVFEGGGLTCIVGPNGCGKSNVIDAVKWVLGEQRPTSLRGREMTDVIFNGTVRRPPMGLCEGTLVFQNSDRVLGEDSDEVQVTRRVFRTGETEYLLNGRPVRLKDVRDLFAGTGLGNGGYAFMEQGKIDAVLANNPQDRRRVFEEAAGISRFRTRRHETELKLQKVDENLARLADVVEEISRQIRSLKLHAGKARSYRELTERLKQVQGRFALARLKALANAEAGIAARLGELYALRDAAQAQRESAKASASTVEGELGATVERVAGAREEHATLAGRLSSLRETIALQRRYAEEADARLKTRRNDASEARRAVEELTEEEIVIRREAEVLARDVQSTATQLAAEMARLQQARQESAECLQVRTAAEKDMGGLERGISAAGADEARAEVELSNQQRNLGAGAERLQRVLADMEQRKGLLGERSGTQGEHTSVLEERRSGLTGAELEVERLETETSRALEEQRRLDSDLSRAQARKDVLTNTLRRGEGLNEGTLAILAERARRPEFLPGFRGLLLNLFEVEFQDARGIEAALGDAAQALVVADGAEAVEGLRFLREKRLGGAIFLPLDRFQDAQAELPAGVRPANRDIGNVLSALLAGVRVLARDEFEAELRSGKHSGAMLVSADGDVLRSGRMLSTPRGGHASAGLVTLQAEARRLEKRLASLAEERDAAKLRCSALLSQRDAARLRVRELSVSLVKAEGDAARLDQEVVRLVNEMERLAQDRELLLTEDMRLREAIEAAELRLETARGEHVRLLEGRQAAQGILEAAREREQAQTFEVDRNQHEVHEVRLAAAKLAEKLDAARARQVFLAAGIRDTEDRAVAASAEESELGRTIQRTRAALELETQELAGAEAALGGVAGRLADVEHGADRVRERMRAASVELDVAEKRLGDLAESIAEVRASEGANKAALSALQSHVREDLGIDLADFELQEARRLQEAEQVPAADVADSAAADVVLEDEVRELKERIQRLGNVNLAAVEELEAAEQRSEFILRERDDLVKSKEHLYRVLKSIEEQSTQLFLDTFNAVREHFSVVYRRLFGGGRAEINLENPDLPLESGIEIRAKPPGKELQSISLLSGGERSLTAVALLFAIFRAHPAPCAFLDEVDAALDEENTERFVRLVAEWREKSQFIVVSHAKRTMEHADRLFGVTMPERGVSRRVSVRIEQIDAQGNLRATEAELPNVAPLESALAARRARPPKTEATETSGDTAAG